MTANFLQRVLSIFRRKSELDPQFIGRQLRKPEGAFAKTIGQKMDQVNAPLFDLTLDTMQLADGESVLEIGFGSGKFFDKVAGQAAGLRISGIDYSPEMVEEAKKNNSSLRDSDALILKRGNSNGIPFPDQSFDKVFCNMVVYFWDRPGEHLREIHRVLKPNGRFYTGIRTKESMEQLPFTRYGFTLYNSDQWRSVLRENGFDVIRIETKPDPKLEMDGRELEMESICMVAEKQVE